MGLSNLSDKELTQIITSKGGLQNFLKDNENIKKFIGLDNLTKRRIADILKYENGMSKADIKKALDEMANITEVITKIIT